MTTPALAHPRLTGTELRLIEQLAYLIELHRQRRPGGTPYATPGREWLAARLGVCVTTISRTTQRLATAGMLRVVQRRPRLGQWQTNLYQIVSAAGWSAARLTRAARTAFRRVTQESHQHRSFNNRLRNNESPSVTPFRDGGGSPPQGSPPPIDLARLPPRIRAVLARCLVQAPNASN